MRAARVATSVVRRLARQPSENQYRSFLLSACACGPRSLVHGRSLRPVTRFASFSSVPAGNGHGDDGDEGKRAVVDLSALADAPGAKQSGDKFVMLYTCTVCETRAAKTISKHAYNNGVVLVRCPGCENLHLIADRLGWFEDESTDVESLLRQRGEQVKVVTEDNVMELTEADLLGQSNQKTK